MSRKKQRGCYNLTDMKEQLRQLIISACTELYSIEVIVEITRPETEFGDFTTNVAMQLAKPLQRSPRDIAQEIATQLQLSSLIKQVGVAGPGFINMTLQDSTLVNSFHAKPQKPMAGMKILVEYSDPNPLKPLHAGHLYTTLVGDAIARIVQNAGAETIRLNYGGDVGLHVGKTMWAVIRYCGGEDLTAVKAVDRAEIGRWMGQRYAEGHVAYEDNEASKAEIIAANKKVYALHEQGDRETKFAQIYWYLRDTSYEFFTDLYERLQVAKFDRFIPESEVTPLGIATVEQQLERGVYEKSDGAVIFDGEKHGLFTNVFINSEGLPTYAAKDVGLSLTKWNDYAFDQSIIITENAQKQYMQVVIKSIEQFAPEPALRTKHLTHGTLKMQGGVKMSSRLGNVLMAHDILDAAEVAGAASGQATNSEIVLGAIKYAFTKTKIGGDVIYDPEESAAMEGNSGPYLQYAHARAKSILDKSAHTSSDLVEDTQLDASERLLLLKVTEYPEIIELATRELAPHHICTYLYELAQTFNRFYEKSKVIGGDREEVRINLVAHYSDTLKNGLNLLGIHAPDSM
jgi:arginyl-tRNA synthetase